MLNSRPLPVLVFSGLAALTLMATATPSHACSFAPLTMHEIDPQEAMVDTTPPAAPELAEVVFVRRPATSGGCGAVSSCDGSGEVGVELLPTSDDRSPPDQIGYIIEFAGGTRPENLGLPLEPVRPDESGTIWLLFSDRDQTLDFQLSVRAVDLAGNEGPALAVDVTSVEDLTCSATALGSQQLTFVLLILAALATTRIRRRVRAPR